MPDSKCAEFHRSRQKHQSTVAHHLNYSQSRFRVCLSLRPASLALESTVYSTEFLPLTWNIQT
jgi:hypothetical protein